MAHTPDRTGRAAPTNFVIIDKATRELVAGPFPSTHAAQARRDALTQRPEFDVVKLSIVPEPSVRQRQLGETDRHPPQYT